MGGEGSMMNANVSLKNNRSMLSKRRGRKAVSGSYANVKMKEFPKASQETIMEIQLKMKMERRKTKVIQVLLFTIVFLVVLLGVVHLLQ